MNKIIETCKFVVDNSQHVKINSEKVDEFVDYFNHSHIKHWFDENFSHIKALLDDRLQLSQLASIETWSQLNGQTSRR